MANPQTKKYKVVGYRDPKQFLRTLDPALVKEDSLKTVKLQTDIEASRALIEQRKKVDPDYKNKLLKQISEGKTLSASDSTLATAIGLKGYEKKKPDEQLTAKEQLTEQMAKRQSGILKKVEGGTATRADSSEFGFPEHVLTPQSKKVKPKTIDDHAKIIEESAPLMVRGEVEVEDADGNVTGTKQVWLNEKGYEVVEGSEEYRQLKLVNKLRETKRRKSERAINKINQKEIGKTHEDHVKYYLEKRKAGMSVAIIVQDMRSRGLDPAEFGFIGPTY